MDALNGTCATGSRNSCREKSVHGASTSYLDYRSPRIIYADPVPYPLFMFDLHSTDKCFGTACLSNVAFGRDIQDMGARGNDDDQFLIGHSPS